MQEDDIERLEAWLDGKKLPPNLDEECESYRFNVDRDYDISLAEAVDELLDRHEYDASAGWLNRRDLTFIRTGLIETGIAKPIDKATAHLVSRSITERTWFTLKGIKYEYYPD
ncbi:MAG: hypothetical protein VXW22_10225 [Pseudomonadota bacterium]|nr:hypothetical protein [Pseudomonadota bacterium]